MRQLIIIGAASVATIGAWWWLKQSRPTPAAVNSALPGQTGDSQKPSPIDYLNFDFSALLGQSSAANSASQKPYTVESDNMIMPRGIANHNPLNIRENHLVDYDWQGEHELDLDPSFEEFVSPYYGIRAAARIMRNYRDKYGLNTVTGIINRWAPPSDNNPTENYIKFVANRAGVGTTTPLSMVDYPKVIAAMIHFENGYNPYDQTEIARATAAGLE